MDVAASSVNANVPNDLDANVSEVLIFAIGKRHRWCHGNGVARVNTNRIKVLDRADNNGVVVLIAHELQLILFPAQDGLFKQDLRCRRGLDAGSCNAPEVLLVIGEA